MSFGRAVVVPVGRFVIVQPGLRFPGGVVHEDAIVDLFFLIKRSMGFFVELELEFEVERLYVLVHVLDIVFCMKGAIDISKLSLI